MPSSSTAAATPRGPCGGAFARGADREREPSPSNARLGAIMWHPLARLEFAYQEVDLAEHAVQLQVEPGQEVARCRARGSS